MKNWVAGFLIFSAFVWQSLQSRPPSNGRRGPLKAEPTVVGSAPEMAAKSPLSAPETYSGNSRAYFDRNVAAEMHPNAMAAAIRAGNRAAAWQSQAAAQAAANAARQTAAPAYGYSPTWAAYAMAAQQPYYENVSQYGNQTYINGSGAFGPFGETITRYGNQTNITGYGTPPIGGYGTGFAPYGGYGYGGIGGGY